MTIESFGAVGDGKTLITREIQAAIDACEAGGTVVIPKGIFVSGALFLKSDMTLRLEAGAVLLGSSDAVDYPVFPYRFEGLETLCYASLINTANPEGQRLRNITIEGEGTVDANGVALFEQEMAEKAGKRGRAICLRGVDHVRLSGITVRQSPAWCVHLIYCQQVEVSGVKIYAKCDENGKLYCGIFNGDGLDIDSCRDVQVRQCVIASQDDCIAIKSGKDKEGRKVGIPSEDILVEDCDFRSGFGVVIGSEASSGVRNVLVRNCRFENAYSVGNVKSPRGRGGVIENIVYEDCTYSNQSTEHQDCEWFRGAIYVDQFYSHVAFDADRAEPVDAGTPLIRDITFRNIRLDTAAGNAIYLAGLPEQPLENIRLEHIHAAGKYGMKAVNVKGLRMQDMTVVSHEDEAYEMSNVTMEA